MEYRTVDDLAAVANITGTTKSDRKMSKMERLRRWQSLLQADPGRVLQTLYETEYQTARARDAMRGDNTAITVAYDDPVLRAEGLQGDTYGDARKFFGLTDNQLHFALCYCYSGPAMSAGTAARRLQSCVPQLRQPGILRRMLSAFSR